ncbi:MAG: EAL domain-containing protein [Pseudomonadales bacterium]|nr:EAL domain-containing protein [Pseudomonadales bacterium]
MINEDRDQYVRMVNLLQTVPGVHYEMTWCADYRHALEAMTTPIHDVVLLDFEHDPAACRELLRAASAHDCGIPIICLTPEIDEDLDRAVIKAGAADYLLKSRLSADSLERAIRYAIDRKQSEAQLARLAHYDLLTGIPNRLLFNDRLDRALQRAKRGDAPFSLLYVDLDGFKAINDTHGHDKGDMLVKGIAQRISHCIRRTDSVARIGGDEFTVLLERASSTTDAVSIAQKIIDVVTEPFDIGTQHVRVGCSIGIATYPDAGQDAHTLLHHADMAMYEAKGIAGSNYRFFTDKMNVEAGDQSRLEQELRNALNEDELGLYFQPRISLRTGKVVGAEALLRWHHPERDVVLPGEFIDLAEHAGLMPSIGYWVLNKLCGDILKLNELGIPPLRLSLNVALTQFAESDFVEGVQKILDNHEVGAERFEFELAEPDLLNNLDLVAQDMRALAERGVRFALDDFGTGFSSLPQLQRLPVSTLKLDTSHVQRVTEDEDAAKIVRAMISLAHGLGLQVVAEGVETEAQKEFLANHRCDQLQGYYYAPPLPFDDFLKLLQKRGTTSRRSYLSVVEKN